MRIAYIISHPGSTGVNRVVMDLVIQMLRHGHDCSVFYLERDRCEMNFPCHTEILQNFQQLVGYDVVHTHGLKPELFIMKNRLKYRNRKEFEKTQFVTTLHCYCFQDFCDLYGKTKGYAMGCIYLITKMAFDQVVCLSKDMLHYYQRWISKRKLTFAYNTRNLDLQHLDVTPEESHLLHDVKENGTLIGMNCVLLYRKGIDVMLNAMTLLDDSFRLVIVGDGKEQETFKEMTKALKLENRVHFMGRKKDAFRFLPYYDIYAMPSRSEGFPLVLLEAAACGTKVVASSLPVVKECFSEEEVITFDMPDAQALADAIVKASQSQQLGKKLQERFQKDYSPTAFYHRYMEIYGTT